MRRTHLQAIGTALPPHSGSQDDVVGFMRRVCEASLVHSSAREAEYEGRKLARTIEQIYDSEGFPADSGGTSAVIESFRCGLQPGKSLADVREAIGIWHNHVTAVNTPFDVFMRTPLVSGNSTVTHSYFVVHENFAAYGDNISAYNTHPDTAGVDAMLDGVQQCTNALWRSERAFTADN